MSEAILVKSMYPCQDIPVVVLGKRCPNPCLYCGLYKKEFPSDKIIAKGEEEILLKLKEYKGAYFSGVTDCFLDENKEITHKLIKEIWKIKPDFIPLVVTKHKIPPKTIKLFIKNKDRLVLQISVPSLNQKITSLLEPGGKIISNRLKIIKKLISNGVPVIVVIMPWLDIYTDKEINSFTKKLSRIGVKRVILGTITLVDEQKQNILNCGNHRISEKVKEITQNEFTFPYDNKVTSFKKIIQALNKYNIKTKICTSDNKDLIKSNLPVCTKFKHHCFKK